jgi:hypothetical protein
MTLSLRILGRCPSCDALDEIVATGNYKQGYSIRCGSCHDYHGNNAHDFIKKQAEDGNRLFLIHIPHLGSRFTQVISPTLNDIPNHPIISEYLNLALMCRYLGEPLYENCMGGVSFFGGGVHVVNSTENLGISVSEQNQGTYGERAKLTKFYRAMLQKLFLEPLRVKNTTFRRGEVLWLEDSEKQHGSVAIYAFAAIQAVTNKDFAELAFRKHSRLNEVQRNSLRGEMHNAVFGYEDSVPFRSGSFLQEEDDEDDPEDAGEEWKGNSY